MLWSPAYFLSLTLGSLVCVGSEAWLSVWWALEAVGLVFMGMLCVNSSISERTDSVFWVYYLTQSIGALSLILGLSSTFYLGTEYLSFSTQGSSISLFELMMMLGLFLKLGVPPFHAWAVRMSENLPWKGFYVVMVVQKVLPLILVFNLSCSGALGSKWMIISAIACSIVSLQGVTENSTRRFLVFSSILNLGWIFMSFYSCSGGVSMGFFLFYLLVMFVVCQILESGQVSSSSQVVGSRFGRFSPVLGLKSFLIVTLMGLPPFPIFLFKVEIIRQSIEVGSEIPPLVLLVFTIALILGYIRLLFPMLMSSFPMGTSPYSYRVLWMASVFILLSMTTLWVWVM